MWETLLNLALTRGCVNLTEFDHCLEINLQRRELILYEQQQVAATYPIAIGKFTTPTPVGNFFVFERSAQTYWRNPDGSVLAYNNPQNPMRPGLYLGWAKGEDGVPYGIHGTNRPNSIGLAISGGCIRLFPQDIRKLYPKVSIGTPVLIR